MERLKYHFFVIICFLGLIESYGQFKYKLEYDITLVGPTSSNRELIRYEISVIDDLSGSFLVFSGSAISGIPPKQFNKVQDEVVDLSFEISSLAHVSEGTNCPLNSGSIPFNTLDCRQNFSSNCNGIYGDYLRIKRIEPLININSSPLYKTCESQNLIVFKDCSLLNYSLEVSVDGSAPLTLLPYGQHSGIYDFQPLDISGIEPGSSVVFTVFYNSDKTESNAIVYDFIACSPKLLNTTKTDETCFAANDGSVTLTFDRNVDATNDYEMRYFLYEGTPPSTTTEANLTSENPTFPGITKQTVADPFIVLNSSFQGTINNLDSGTYFIVYQEVKYDRDPLDGTDPTIVKSGELSGNFTIVSPTQVITSGTLSPSTCGNEASIALSASGGNATNGYTYQYSINNNTNWQAASNPLEIAPTANQQTIYVRALVAGNTDCFGNTQSFVINPSTLQLAITGNPTFVPPTTATSTDGSIRIEIENGASNYTYVLTNVNSNQVVETIVSPLKTIDFLNVAIGTYSVTVTDAEGCQQISGNTIVTKEPIPTLTANTPTQITCFNSTDGEVSVQIDGIISSYKYQWIINSSTSVIQTSTSATLTLSNLNIGGSYVLRVASGRLSDADFTNANNYTEITIPFNNPSEVIINNATPNNTSCNSGTDGSISLDLSGGNTYEYALGNSPTNWLPLTGNTITNLSADSYTITVRNENGCESQPFTSIFVDEPTAIEILEVPNSRQDVSINGGSDGAIFIEVIGGTAPYSFNWAGPVISNQQNPTNLTTGNYSVTVTDANLCTQTLGPLFINEPSPLGITTLNPTNVLCKGDATGSITAVVTGVPNFTYTWTKDGDTAFTAPNLGTITDLAFGTYTLTLTDATGDPAVTRSVLITEPTDALTATATPIPASCFNGTDGQITVFPSGGTAPYQFDFNIGLGFQNNPTLNNMSSDTYNITVLDASGCEYIVTNVAVDQATELIITPDQVLNVSEAGENDGAIYTSTSGGNLPYTYSWSGPNSYTAVTKNITGLIEGFYTLIVTDATNCTTSQTFNITQPGALVVDVQQTLFLACNDDNFAEIAATVQGGVPNYTYQWFQISNGNNTLLSETSALLANLTAGNYYVVVTDANNVTRTSSTIVVTEPETLVATLSNKIDVLCSGNETGSIQLTISGGTAPYAFYWNNILNTQNISNLAAGDYYFDVIDANGCSDQLEITIEESLNPLVMASETVTDASAYQTNDGSITIEISGGAPDYSYSWTRLSDNTLISNQNSINNLTADDYQIVITDTNGCSLTEVYEINQPDIIEETIIAPICTGGDNGSISLIVNKGNGSFTYSWNTGATTSSINNLSAGEYTVVITGFDQPISRTYTVEDPSPIQVNLGNDRVLCVDQILELDATVENLTATYLWSSDTGFSNTNPIVVLTQQGNYTLTITTATGCSATGSINLELSDEEISAEFAVSSQTFVGETLILVDISYPLPDSMEWIIPENVQILKQNNDEAELVFDTPGEYEIGIITQKGPCTEVETKKILVLATDPTVTETDTEGGKKIVENFIVYPNPTTGIFKADVTMSEIGNISIKIFSFANNSLIAVVKERGKSSYSIPFDISNMPAGVYAILLETPYGATLRKIIIK